MSALKINSLQIGQSLSATNNFTWYQPTSPDGTVRLGNGNSGSVTDLVTLTNAGNLGIGTASPGYRLEVAYGSTSDALVITGSVDNTTPYLSFKASNGGSSYIRGRVRGTAPDSTNGGLAFDTGASGSMSEKMRLDSSGNLGIGTNSPLGILNTAGSGDQNIWFTHSDNVSGRTVTLRLGNNNSTYKNNSPFIRCIQGSGIDSYSLSFGSSNGASVSVERLLIDSYGRVTINGGDNNGTHPYSSPGIYFQRTTAASEVNIPFIRAEGDATTTHLSLGPSSSGGSLKMYTGSGGLSRVIVDSAGRVTMPYQPAFSAFCTAQIVGPAVVKFGGTKLNVGSHYNTSTGVFTAPVTGKYLFNVFGNVYLNSTAAIHFYIRKNGSKYGTSVYTQGNNSWVSMASSEVIYLSAGDSVDVYLTTTGAYFDSAADPNYWSSFNGCLLG